MISSYNVIAALTHRYDYGGALELMKEKGLEHSPVAVIMNSCRYAVNFDFKKAKKILHTLPIEYREVDIIKKLDRNLEELIQGVPDAIFSELMENLKFQIVNEEYIDFLGRVYRFKEAVLKYIFVVNSTNKRRFSFIEPLMEKRVILKSLRKKYKIYNSNLMYGISTYISRHLDKESKFGVVEGILNSKKMNNLMELRNSSIVGHGFVGVSIDDIHRNYGNPYNVLDDFDNCLKKLEIKLIRFKYSIINDYIIEELSKMDNLYRVNSTAVFE